MPAQCRCPVLYIIHYTLVLVDTRFVAIGSRLRRVVAVGPRGIRAFQRARDMPLAAGPIPHLRPCQYHPDNGTPIRGSKNSARRFLRGNDHGPRPEPHPRRPLRNSGDCPRFLGPSPGVPIDTRGGHEEAPRDGSRCASANLKPKFSLIWIPESVSHLTQLWGRYNEARDATKRGGDCDLHAGVPLSRTGDLLPV